MSSPRKEERETQVESSSRKDNISIPNSSLGEKKKRRGEFTDTILFSTVPQRGGVFF